MILEYTSYALKSIGHRRLRSWLTMLGIFIGIAAVVSLISLGQGLQNAITGQFSSLGTDKIIVQAAGTSFSPPGSTAVTPLTQHDLDIVKRVNGVKNSVGRLLRVVKVEFNNQPGFSFAVSIPKDPREIDLVEKVNNLEAEEGRLLLSQDINAVVLGNDFRSEDIFGKSVRVGNKISINGKDFQVVGFLKKSSSIQGNRVIIMPEESMRALLNVKDIYDIIAVQVDNPDNIERVAEDIKRDFRRDRNEKKGEEDFTVQTPAQVVESIDTVLNIVNGIIIGIAAISLLVGGIGIMNTMYTAVLERTREIGVMKAIGARNKDVLLIFLIESGLLGFIGGAIGIAIGLGLAFGVEFASSSYFGQDILKVQASLPLIIGSLIFSISVGIFSGLFPARSAAIMKPVEALRQ